MGKFKTLGGGLLLVALFIGSFSVFTVKEWERAILFRLGEIVRDDYTPGLKFKVPFINNVRKFDARIQTLDLEPERFLTSEKKNVIVDSFVKWRIRNVGRYYTAVRGDVAQANLRLDQILKDGLRSEFGKRTLKDTVSGDRAQIMEILTASANPLANEIGIEVVDVRIKRADLPQEVQSSVFSRMQAEREREAKRYRSEGEEEAAKLRAETEKQRTIVLAEAEQMANKLRGEGDAAAARIYAEAYGRDPDFYSFVRSLQAYEQFVAKRSTLLLSADSALFRHLGQEPASQDSPHRKQIGSTRIED
jgi:membrane protease subunit HflC